LGFSHVGFRPLASPFTCVCVLHRAPASLAGRSCSGRSVWRRRAPGAPRLRRRTEAWECPTVCPSSWTIATLPSSK